MKKCQTVSGRKTAGVRRVAFLGSLLFVAHAFAGGAHDHGVARLDVVIEGSRVVIDLDSPLDNVLGFEHAPRNEKQRGAIRKLDSTLQSADLFKPNPEAACKLVETRQEHPYRDALVKGPSTSAQGAKSTGDHADLEANWTYQCENPAALRLIDVKLFATFTGLRSLKVQLAGPRGQSSMVLRAGRSVIAW